MKTPLGSRFRGFLPVIIDVECGGIDPLHDALLEVGAVSIRMDDNGLIHPDREYHYHIEPFEGARLNPESLAFNKIDPYHPFRFAVPEKQAFEEFFKAIKKESKEKGCSRAVIVGHNAWFDQHFVNAVINRNPSLKNPFHRFTSFDTATMGALAYGQSVLSKALQAAGIPFDAQEAHSAVYDARATALLFCKIVNRWKELGGMA